MNEADLGSRIRRLEDQEAIRNLVAMYGFVIDELDVDGIRRLFTEDARFGTPDGFISTTGLDELIEMYQGRFGVNGVTYHWINGHVIALDDDPNIAHGLVSGHMEVSRQGVPLVGAVRYHDTYARTADGWKFRERLMTYGYYLDVREWPEAIHAQDRVRIYGDGRTADWPEVLQGRPRPDWLDRFLAPSQF